MHELNKKTFLNLIFKKAQSGEIPVYVWSDKSKTDWATVNDVYFANEFDIRFYEWDISSVIFEENWYVNPETLDFEKIVCGIAPVLLADGKKKVPFMVKMNTDKCE